MPCDFALLFSRPMSHAKECQEGHRTVRSTTAMVAVCSKCDCVFRGTLARQCASPSRSCPHIEPSMSGSRSFFDFHTGDRCSFERYYCITAVAPLLLHRFALFAASNCVSCRAFALRCTQVFVTHLKGVKVFFFLFRRSNLRPNESRPPFCNSGTGLRVIDCRVPRCFAAVMAMIMQRFLLWEAIAKWRQQGHPRIWEDVSQEARLCKQSGVRT